MNKEINRLKAENASLKRALQDEQDRLGSILQSIVDGVYTTDADRKITFWNDGAERITGFKSGDVIGKPCSDILCHTDEDGNSLCDTACPIASSMSGRNSIIGKDVYSGTSKGKPLPVSVSCSPIIDKSGNTTGAIEVFRDISSQKQLERQKEDFYSMLTHDLKSPLQVIMGYAELMAGMQPAELIRQSPEFLDIIQRNCRSMYSLINDFLGIARLETGAMPLDRSSSNISAFIKHILEDFIPTCKNKGIQIKAELPDSPLSLEFDRKLMERALSNIINNAVKFTPDGGMVLVSLIEKSGNAIIKVSDTGPGIGPDEIGLVFEKYYRAKSTAGADGSGLGLAIVKSIVEAHGGGITVQSTPGKGSDFIISLPIDNQAEDHV